MNFEDYYKGLGFSRYPFGVFTSEGEKKDLTALFLRPDNYSIIVEGLRSTSAIVTGERGTGKTALSLSLQSELAADDQLMVRVEEFTRLKVNFDEDDLYRFLTEEVAAAFFLKVTESPSILWRYTKEERIDLSMYLHVYVSASSRELLREKINKIQNGVIKRWSVNAYNYGRVVLNYGLKAATKAIGDAISKHFSSLPEFDSGDAEYFKKIEEHIDDTFAQNKLQYYYLMRLCKLVKKHAFKKIYIVVDKVDEDSRFENDADNVSEFIVGIASNNKVLTNEEFHVVLFMWSTPFNYIRSSVRTQKLTFQQLEWSRPQLERVIIRRMQAYSDGAVSQISDLFDSCSTNNIELLFRMCNSNPRDLWHIVDKCFKEQFILDPSRRISDLAIEQGVNRYVTEFNYYEYYPRKSSARANSMDVYSYIKHLVKLDSAQFTKDRLNDKAGTGSSTNNYVVAMENMGLIRKTAQKAQGGAVIYEIRDPKVCYAMENGIAIGL
ncbi:ATP-binding protein [Pseudomonas sp. PDM32]|uniref:ATP-binding protein n=1 Tax=Pseudomonas sp. PDM32 TaxID=2854768 RepID=UPI001C473BDE|nr:ATP-binding protein [Pseudomonas sp. PDM32]MBV7575919.1 ATP-binding protein [Pseudomonas sp. PDM32]